MAAISPARKGEHQPPSPAKGSPPQGVSKIKILWYNKGYEKENGRGMEKMPEMRKD